MGLKRDRPVTAKASLITWENSRRKKITGEIIVGLTKTQFTKSFHTLGISLRTAKSDLKIFRNPYRLYKIKQDRKRIKNNVASRF